MTSCHISVGYSVNSGTQPLEPPADSRCLGSASAMFRVSISHRPGSRFDRRRGEEKLRKVETESTGEEEGNCSCM